MDNNISNLEGKLNFKYLYASSWRQAHTCPLTDDPTILDGTYLVRLSAAAQERLEIVAEKDLHDLEPTKSLSIDDIKRELEEEEEEGSGLTQYATQIKVGKLKLNWYGMNHW